MSFILSATKALVPPLPLGYPSVNLSEMWIGQGADANMLVFQAGSQWRMVRNNVSSSEATGSAAMLPAVVVNGSNLYPIFRACGGYLYFSNGSRTLWFVEGFGWVYMADGAPGYVPEEYTNEDGLRWGTTSMWRSLSVTRTGRLSRSSHEAHCRVGLTFRLPFLGNVGMARRQGFHLGRTRARKAQVARR